MNIVEVHVDPTNATRTMEKAHGTVSWQAELADQPWSEATRMARKARRPSGWQTTPRQLLEPARLGESRAVSLLCERYWELVRNYLRRRRNTPREFADDATNEFFAGLVRRDEKRNDFARLNLAPEESFGAWLAKGARNALCNERRREKRHEPLLLEPSAVPQDIRVETQQRAISKPQPAESRLAERQLADERLGENRAMKVFELHAQGQARLDNMTSDRLLDLARVLDLVERAFDRLRPEYDERLFDHLKTTLLEEELEFDPSDAEICERLPVPERLQTSRRLRFSSTYVSQNRSRMRWEELPRAMLAVQKERRARNLGSLGLASPGEELRALADELP